MKTRILVVDDEPQFSHWLKLKLEGTGHYRVREENDPQSALAAAREFWPDLVILDVMMPEMDGSEVASLLREDPVLGEITILFMTALVSGREAPAGTCSSGGQVFLPKAISISRLIECIEAHTNRAQALSA